MPLPAPRPGNEKDFLNHFYTSEETTLGDSEKLIWSLIKHLCSFDIADSLLFRVHKVKNKRTRSSQIKNLNVYIQQAYKLYEAGKFARANTAPLFYYYSFLNLAKALCEIKFPNFHKLEESYKHGISWKPNKNRKIDMKTEFINLSTRGVWHCLQEYLTNVGRSIRNPTKLNLPNLFSYCPEISVEYRSSYEQESKLIRLIEPQIFTDTSNTLCWLRFSVDRSKLNLWRISRNQFKNLISAYSGTFSEVKSKLEILYTFELTQTRSFDQNDSISRALSKEINDMNLFVVLGKDGLDYSVPVQNKLQFKISQILVLYTIMFWLSSLVRYDPHSMETIQKSKYWILIDGFMNQSRIWLLELFEWEFYKTQRILLSSR